MKDDASTDDTQYEFKDAAKSYTLKGAELRTLFRHAVRQGKEPVFVVFFKDADMTATITITKGRP